MRNREIDWGLTFLAVTATAAHSVLVFYRPVFLFSARKLLADAVQVKKIIGKLFMLPSFFVLRSRMLLSITKHLILVTLGASGLMAAIFAYFGKLSL